MKIYCLYGTNLPTERSYYYAQAAEESSSEHCGHENCSESEKSDAKIPDLDEVAVDMATSLSSTAEEILRPPNLASITLSTLYLRSYADSNYIASLSTPTFMIQRMEWKPVFDFRTGKRRKLQNYELKMFS